ASEIQTMQVERARLGGAWEAADRVRADIRAAEELVLTALAAGADGEDIVESAREARVRFRAAYFWLLVARLDRRDAITLAAHGPDHGAGLLGWTRAMLDVCERYGWGV